MRISSTAATTAAAAAAAADGLVFLLGFRLSYSLLAQALGYTTADAAAAAAAADAAAAATAASAAATATAAAATAAAAAAADSLEPKAAGLLSRVRPSFAAAGGPQRVVPAAAAAAAAAVCTASPAAAAADTTAAAPAAAARMASASHPPPQISQEQTEQVRLLGQLVKADAANNLVKQDAVMLKQPDWAVLERAGLIAKGMAPQLAKLHDMSANDKSDAIEQNPALVVALVNVLRLETDIHPAQYALTILYEVVRENASRYDVMCAALDGTPLFEDFLRLLTRPGVDAYTGDRAAFMLSGFMSRARTNAFSENEVKHFVHSLISNTFPVSEPGRLDALVNILKIDRWRPLVWETRNVPETLRRGLALTQPAGVIYKAVFCCWLLSFREEFPLKLTASGIVQAVCQVVTECRVEKVVRVGLHVIENLLPCEEAVEIIIEQNVAQVLALLEFEKWRDADMYDEIRACIFALDLKIRQFNNFERYLMELEKGRLKWSVLHSEKFWRENVMVFEKDEFATIQKIEKLLDSPDPTTQAVACYDLGEFARLHPAGKKVCQKFKVKDKVMLLITNKNREVAGEALLCVQKLMLNNWQDVAKPPTKA
ncbi:hypothetical protein Efla_002057 [Eimeria flavescens]